MNSVISSRIQRSTPCCLSPGRKLGSGFTLIEMLAVLAIVGILASIAMPLAELAHKRHQEEELRSALRQIRSALDAYKQATDEGHIPLNPPGNGYPPNLDVLVDGVDDARSPVHSRIYFLRALPRDPFAPVDGSPNAPTWSLRSYASPPDDPEPGEDIYDVHSSSSEIGLDGTPYRLW